MMDANYTPAILGATITPNPVEINGTIKISVIAVDVEQIPLEMVYMSGEFHFGEV